MNNFKLDLQLFAGGRDQPFSYDFDDNIIKVNLTLRDESEHSNLLTDLSGKGSTTTYYDRGQKIDGIVTFKENYTFDKVIGIIGDRQIECKNIQENTFIFNETYMSDGDINEIKITSKKAGPSYKQVGGSSGKLYQHNIRFRLGTWPGGSYMCNVHFIVINNNLTPLISNEADFDSFVKFLTSDYFIPCCGMATWYNIHFSGQDADVRIGDSYLINGIRAKSTVPDAIYLSGLNMTTTDKTQINNESEIEIYKPPTENDYFSISDDVTQIL